MTKWGNLMPKKRFNIFVLILHVVCIAIILGAVIHYALLAYQDWQAAETAEKARIDYERLVAAAALEITPSATPEPTFTPTPMPTATPEATPTPTSSPTPTPKQILPLFAQIRQEYDNDDIVGYLKIDGTSIDYLVTQSSDNSHYLDKDIYQNYSVAGWVFMDYENDILRDDFNTIIYGHNMRKDIMFHALRYYKSKEFFESHRFITFNTAYEEMTWEVFSFYRASIQFPYVQVLFSSEDEFMELAYDMKSRSAYDTGVEIGPGDRILTLSTCSMETEDTRYVVNAKLVRKDDASEVSFFE
jgi:sortase B